MSGLPIGWTNAPGEDLFASVRGVTYNKADASSSPASGLVPILRANNISDGEIVTDDLVYVPAKYVSSDQYLRSGDLLIATSSGSRTVVGKAAPASAAHERYAFGAFCTVARPRTSEVCHWLSSFTRSRSYREYVEQVALGISINNLRGSDLKAMPIAVAPLPEQRRIVTKIGSLAGKSKRAREHLDHIPRLVEKYKQAVLAAAFRGELTRDWRAAQPVNGLVSSLSAVRQARKQMALTNRRRTALENLPQPRDDFPAIPREWSWSCVEELASDEPRSVQSGPFGSSLLHSEFKDEGYLVIGIDNVQDGQFILGSEHRISEEKFHELSKFEARPEDVLITVMATIGRVCVVPLNVERSIISKHVYRITVDKLLIEPNFLMNAFRGAEAALAHFGANIRGQTRPGINGQILKSLFIPLPSVAEQKEIVRRIEAAFSWIDRLATDVTRARTLISHLDQAVLTKAFRGELVPQDHADEPASVLLQRIKSERSTKPKMRARQAAGGNT